MQGRDATLPLFPAWRFPGEGRGPVAVRKVERTTPDQPALCWAPAFAWEAPSSAQAYIVR